MLKTASWILLTVVGALTLLGGLASARLAYTHGQEPFGQSSLTELAAGREDVAVALHARRGTAAAYAAAFAVFFLRIVLGPYRRGDKWSWWTLLVGSTALALLSCLRVVALDTWQGASVAVVQFGVVVFALLLDVGRLKSLAAS